MHSEAQQSFITLWLLVHKNNSL